ncbi:MAG: spermidine/putrescine ABC transporter substrate-binding protein [Chloroflexota bacterium]|nr:MAG: spermidine/putrescine ABC transporter substrate-binding protein [Chloroflexota bacterium]
MKKALYPFLLILLIALLATACASEAATPEAESEEPPAEEAPPEEAGEKVLNFYNWSEYIEPEIFALFEEETGIKVVEDTFGSNEDLLAKLQGGATGYDVIVPSDYMVATMVELGMLAEIDHSKLENFANLDPSFTDPPYDPGLAHCVPYFWGTTGIGFNWNDWEEAPSSWEYLFNPENATEFEGRISLLDDMREVLGAALISLGYSPNSTNEAELQEAKEVVLAIKPYVAAFDSDTYEDNLVTGDVALVLGWSGDVFTAQVEDENIDYVIPEEGAVKWTDNLCITADAAADPQRLEMAYQWIDFLNRPEIAGMNTNFVWYASPNAAAEEFIDPEILGYEAVYPPEEVFTKLQFLENVGEATELYSRIWTEISTE